MPEPKDSHKPILRGYFHQEAFFVALGACPLLIAKSSTPLALLASIVYSFGLVFMFATSAIYHRPHWKSSLKREIVQRFDHSAIFLLIAGTFTPICLLGLPEPEGLKLMRFIWTAAAAGILQSFLWVSAPKWLLALLYVAIGWSFFPYLPELEGSLGRGLIPLVLGGVFYTVGAMFYAFKRPNFRPGIFGYHELFHLFTVVAAVLHFSAVYRLIQ